MHRSELLPNLTSSKSIKNYSIGASTNNNELSKSTVSQKTPANEQLLHQQIVKFRQKAHQSFMQVIQIQQLHEQELNQLRASFAQKQNQYQFTIENLKSQLKKLSQYNAVYQMSSRYHMCDFKQKQLQIYEIEPIICQNQSRLDESTIINFRDVIDFNSYEDQVNKFRSLVNNLMNANSNDELVIRLNQTISKMLDLTSLLKRQNYQFQKINIQLQSQNKKSLSQINKAHINYEILQKQTKFMAQNIKRLSADKMKVEKMLMQNQRNTKLLENKLHKMILVLAKNGIRIEQHDNNGQQHNENDKSLDLNEFISFNLIKMESNKQLNPRIRGSAGILRKIID